MALVRTLLERLEEPEMPEEREHEESHVLLLESIRSNLGRILNSQRGSSATVPDYGLTELPDLSLNEDVMRRIESDLKKSIERFEPRLEDVRVRFVAPTDQRLSLRFDVVATIRIYGEARSARFLTTMEPSRELNVRRA